MSRIIVGVDGTHRADDAAAFARDIAAATGSSILLTYVYPYAPIPARVSGGQIERYLREQAEMALRDVRARVDGLEDAESRTIADPSPARGLHQVAEAEEAALVVIGSSHLGHLGHVLVGSTAMRLTHGSPCAIAVVPRGYADRQTGFERLGCAFDSSPEATTALETASAAAAALGAQLSVIHAFDLGGYAELVRMTGEGGGPDVSELEDGVRTEIESTVDRLAPLVPTNGILRAGPPAEVLAEESEQLDVLFAGSRGYGPHSAVLLGSVTARLLDQAACPVVVLPRGAKPQLLDVFSRAAAAKAP